MSEELWAARDWTGELHQFAGEPFPEEGLRSDQTVFVRGDEDGDEYFGELPPNILPDLKPGEKCRVTITRLAVERHRPPRSNGAKRSQSSGP